MGFQRIKENEASIRICFFKVSQLKKGKLKEGIIGSSSFNLPGKRAIKGP